MKKFAVFLLSMFLLTGCTNLQTEFVQTDESKLPEEEVFTETTLTAEESHENDESSETGRDAEESDRFENTPEAIGEYLESAGITKEHFSYEFIRSFVMGEYGKIAPMIGLHDGMEKCFDGFEIGEWTAEPDMDFEPFYSPFDETMRPVILTIEIKESKIEKLNPGTHVLYVQFGAFYSEIELSIDPGKNIGQTERSPACSALNMWLGTVGSLLPVYDENASDEDREIMYSAVGDYLGCLYGIDTLEEYERLAEICFGMNDFKPVGPLMQDNDGRWFVGGHGGSVVYSDMISENTDGDTTTIILKRYADYLRFVEADLIEFVMRETGEVINGVPVFIFEKVTVTPLSEWKAGGYVL